jgi:hypothetical protein
MSKGLPVSGSMHADPGNPPTPSAPTIQANGETQKGKSIYIPPLVYQTPIRRSHFSGEDPIGSDLPVRLGKNYTGD